MAANRLILPVVNRPRLEDRLHGAKDRLDHPEMLVRERRTVHRQAGVRPQDPFAVVLGIGGDLGLIDGKPRARRLQKPPKPLVPDQRLVPLRQRLLQRGDNGLAVVAILLRLVRIDTDDVAAGGAADLVAAQRAWSAWPSFELRLRTPRR